MTAEGENLLNQRGRLIGRRLNRDQAFVNRAARGVVHPRQFEIADDRGEDVVEVVRDAAGQRAMASSLRLEQLALEKTRSLGVLAGQDVRQRDGKRAEQRIRSGSNACGFERVADDQHTQRCARSTKQHHGAEPALFGPAALVAAFGQPTAGCSPFERSQLLLKISELTDPEVFDVAGERAAGSRHHRTG